MWAGVTGIHGYAARGAAVGPSLFLGFLDFGKKNTLIVSITFTRFCLQQYIYRPNIARKNMLTV